ERQKDVLGKEGPFKIQVVFEVPGESEFKPWYVEFKQGGRALIPEKRIGPSDTGAASGKSKGTVRGARRSDTGETPAAKGGDTSSSNKPKETVAPKPEEKPKAVKKVGAPTGGRTHINNVIEKGTDVTDLL